MKERPVCVTVLGWTFFAGGVMGVLQGLLNFAAIPFLKTVMKDVPGLPPDIPPMFLHLWEVFHHFAEIGVFLVVFGGFTVYASLEFLKGKGWVGMYLP